MEKLVELVFVLDMSGSMSGLESDTIGGYNSILKKQSEEEGDVRVTTVLFNTGMKMVHDGKNIKEVDPLSSMVYIPSGCTALLDAIGNTISHVSAKQEALKEEKPSKTLMVITTDGLENSSREFSIKAIRTLIESKKANGWEFLFLGANIDALETGESFGISKDYSVDYLADSRGSKVMYDCLCQTVSDMRREGKVKRSWKHKIEEDTERK